MRTLGVESCGMVMASVSTCHPPPGLSYMAALTSAPTRMRSRMTAAFASPAAQTWNAADVSERNHVPVMGVKRQEGGVLIS